jgi:hypothetical protein
MFISRIPRDGVEPLLRQVPIAALLPRLLDQHLELQVMRVHLERHVDGVAEADEGDDVRREQQRRREHQVERDVRVSRRG